MRTNVIWSLELNNPPCSSISENLSREQQVAKHTARFYPSVRVIAGPSLLESRLFIKTAKIIAMSICCLAFIPATALGEAWLVNPSLSLSGEYNDNFELDTESPLRGFSTELKGGLEVGRLTEIWQFRGYGQFNAIGYSTNNPDDRVNELDNTINYFLGFSGRYKPELQEWLLNGAYRRDTLINTIDLAVTQEGVNPEPGEDVDVKRQTIAEEVKRDRLTLNPSWSNELTARTRAQVAYNFNDVSYSKTIDFTDYRNHLITGQLFYDISEKDSFNTALGANYYRDDDDNQYDSYGLLAGIDHRFSETTKGGFRAGYQHTSFQSPFTESTKNGFLGSLFGSQETKWGTFSATLERALYPSGTDGVVQTDQILLSMDRELSPRSRFLLAARAFRTETLGVITEKNRYLSIEPSLKWAISESWFLVTSYNYQRQKEQDSAAADSNAVLVTLGYLPKSPFPYRAVR
jgi:hypothetical protein